VILKYLELDSNSLRKRVKSEGGRGALIVGLR